MARITIPPQHRIALVSVAGMSQEAFEELFAVLRDASPSATSKQLVSRTAECVKHTPSELAANAVLALVSLAVFRSSTNRTVEEVTSGITEELSGDIPSAIEVFRDRIRLVLTLPSLVMASKAFQLMQDHQAVLDKVTILSDVRPVFDDDDVTGAVVVHSLKVSFRDSGQAKVAFFALDDDDLLALKKAIARAEMKSKAMRTLFEKASITVFSQGPGGDL